MNDRCWCGDRLEHFYASWRCGGFRRPCCPACAERHGADVRCVACTRDPRSVTGWTR